MEILTRIIYPNGHQEVIKGRINPGVLMQFDFVGDLTEEECIALDMGMWVTTTNGCRLISVDSE